MKNLFLLFILLTFLSCNRKVAKHSYNSNDKTNQELTYVFTEALKQHLFGNYRQALSLYKKCLELDSRSAATYFQLSNIFIVAGNKDESIQFAKTAVDLDKNNFWYLANLAKIYNVFKVPDSAIIIYQTIHEKYPDKIEYSFELADLLMNNGKYKEALEVLLKIENYVGVNEQVILSKIECYNALKKIDKAESEANRLIEAFPDEVTYLNLLAEIYRRSDRDKDAVDLYFKILDKDPNNRTAQIGLADYYLQTKKFDDAQNILLKLIKNIEIDEDTKKSIMVDILKQRDVLREFKNQYLVLIDTIEFYSKNRKDYLLLKSDFYNSIDSTHKCFPLLEEYLKIDKKNLLVWQQIVYLSSSSKRYSKTIEYCDSAIALYPAKIFFYIQKAFCYYQNNKYDSVILVLKNYVSNDLTFTKEERLQLYNLISESYYRINDFKNAEIFFNKIIEIDPDNYIVLNNYAYYLSLRAEKLSKALEMSKLTIIAQPNNSTFLDTYAWVLYKSGNYSEALKYIEKAIKNGGVNNKEIILHYGDILFCLGKKDEAINTWNLALDLGVALNVVDDKVKNFKCE